MNRGEMLERLKRHGSPWDIIVIGGGATGAGIAVDAAARGYSVALFEQSDFGKGTSSRSTKLVHGGVRYLRQGNVGLVREALRERAILRRNAPHLVADLPLLVPAYARWERAYYGAGLALYDLLGGRSEFGRSTVLSRNSALQQIPTLRDDDLRGGVLYHDGQFDDARLLINLVQTAAIRGAVTVNYARVEALSMSAGRVNGVVGRDAETGEELRVSGRVVINATGAFVDGIRRLAAEDIPPLVVPSQGTHLVLPRAFLPSSTALMIPAVGEGRVMFAIPWQGHTLVGTTDTGIPAAALEPRALPEEVDFLLSTYGRYLQTTPTRRDVRSVFTGIRPLVRRGEARITAAVSRDHTIEIHQTGLVTITGGKWTTYRRMAEEAVTRAAAAAGLSFRPSPTEDLAIHGASTAAASRFAAYGTDAGGLERLCSDDPDLAQPIDPELPTVGAEVVWAARHEMARTVEDVLARRSRALFLNAAAARRMSGAVAALLARELGRSDAWQQEQVREFHELAQGYMVPSMS